VSAGLAQRGNLFFLFFFLFSFLLKKLSQANLELNKIKQFKQNKMSQHECIKQVFYLIFNFNYFYKLFNKCLKCQTLRNLI